MKTFLQQISLKTVVCRVTPCIRMYQRKAVRRGELIWRFAGLRTLLKQKLQFRAGGATGSERAVQYAVILYLAMCNSSDTKTTVPPRLVNNKRRHTWFAPSCKSIQPLVYDPCLTLQCSCWHPLTQVSATILTKEHAISSAITQPPALCTAAES
jgi:hypothetical protein